MTTRKGTKPWPVSSQTAEGAITKTVKALQNVAGAMGRNDK